MPEILLLVKAFFSYMDLPAVALGLMLCAGWFIVRSAGKSGEFKFSNMLKDPDGSESITKVATVAALGFSSWFLMYDSIHSQKGEPTVLLIYLLIWSGVPVAMKLGDALIAKWSK